MIIPLSSEWFNIANIQSNNSDIYPIYIHHAVSNVNIQSNAEFIGYLYTLNANQWTCKPFSKESGASTPLMLQQRSNTSFIISLNISDRGCCGPQPARNRLTKRIKSNSISQNKQSYHIIGDCLAVFIYLIYCLNIIMDINALYIVINTESKFYGNSSDKYESQILRCNENAECTVDCITATSWGNWIKDACTNAGVLRPTPANSCSYLVLLKIQDHSLWKHVHVWIFNGFQRIQIH